MYNEIQLEIHRIILFFCKAIFWKSKGSMVEKTWKNSMVLFSWKNLMLSRKSNRLWKRLLMVQTYWNYPISVTTQKSTYFKHKLANEHCETLQFNMGHSTLFVEVGTICVHILSRLWNWQWWRIWNQIVITWSQ